MNFPISFHLKKCVQMPEMDGFMLARAIKIDPAIARTRLIVLTSLGQALSAAELKEAGIEACLVKPVKQSRLFDCLVSVLGKSTDENLITRRTRWRMVWKFCGLWSKFLILRRAYDSWTGNNMECALRKAGERGLDLLLHRLATYLPPGFSAIVRETRRSIGGNLPRRTGVPNVGTSQNFMGRCRCRSRSRFRRSEKVRSGTALFVALADG
jgi:CheY-like chemotaxis protein